MDMTLNGREVKENIPKTNSKIFRSTARQSLGWPARFGRVSEGNMVSKIATVTIATNAADGVVRSARRRTKLLVPSTEALFAFYSRR